MLKLLQLSTALVLLSVVSACSTTGRAGNCYGAIRLSEATIAKLNDAEVDRVLTFNEQEAAKGCAVRNQ